MLSYCLKACSVRKLVHPYYYDYRDFILNNLNNEKKLLRFLTMVKLKESNLKWALKQKDKKNDELAYICGVKVRRFQYLKAEYKKTGKVPKLNPNRRPSTELTLEQKELINKAQKESQLTGAVSLRLYIKKYYDKTIPNNKLHLYLLKNKISQPDPKKQKQRKYCRYERKHSFSLGHTDYHTSKVIPGKELIIWIDDASRIILAGGEFKEATTENAKKIVKDAQKKAWEEYRGILFALNTDKGCQFYANNTNKKGERAKSEFEEFLKEEGINHITSRRNHPQTNGKNERWHRTYEEKRGLFDTFDEFIEWYNKRIHLGLSRTEGITPNEAVLFKLRQESMLGKFWEDK